MGFRASLSVAHGGPNEKGGSKAALGLGARNAEAFVRAQGLGPNRLLSPRGPLGVRREMRRWLYASSAVKEQDRCPFKSLKNMVLQERIELSTSPLPRE